MPTRVRALVLSVISTLLFVVFLFRIVELNSLFSSLAVSDQAKNLLGDFAFATLISLVIAIGTGWVLFFKKIEGSVFSIGIFPGAAILPYTLLSQSIVSSVFSGLGQIPAGIVVAAIFFVIAYLLILTANILNGSILFNIPLGQAGKAAQFIFSLISTYLLLVYSFTVINNVEFRALLVFAFSMYFAYSCIWMLQITSKQIVSPALLIALLVVAATLLISMWPIATAYATATIIVFYYICLNVALEIRHNLGRMIWVEYAILVSLVIIILIFNSSWGINGNIF